MADNMDKYIIDNIKLSACRHCGGEAELYTHHDVINDEDIAFIMCKKCGIQTREVDISIRFDSPFSIQDQCKWTPLKDIIKEWNANEPMERIEKQLEKEREYYYLNDDIFDGWEVDAVDRCIDIVRKGGVNE